MDNVLCLHCHRLMAKETCMDLQDEAGIMIIPVLQCLNCGEVVDPLILKHRMRAPAPMMGHARVAPKTALTGSGATNGGGIDLSGDRPS